MIKLFFGYILCFSITFDLAVCVPAFFNGRGSEGLVHRPSVNLITAGYTNIVHNKTIIQKIDHFDENNNSTFEQRYCYNSINYQPGGPMFLLISGESAISQGFMVSGTWIRYAQIFGALCFQVEHRYYGKSIPFDNLTVDSLEYLTSKQALADLAHFVKSMTNIWQLDKSQKWIVFGGSYAGDLTVWFREKYPHLVHGAIRTSSPVQLETDFSMYLYSVSKTLRNYDGKCAAAIKDSFATLSKLLKDEDGQSQLDSIFNFCHSCLKSSKLDKQQIANTLVSSFMDIVQYNGINSNFGSVSVKQACSVMNNANIGEPIERLSELTNIYLGNNTSNCIGTKYSKFIREMKATSLRSSVASGSRQWFYQNCNELGFFQTTDNLLTLFGHFITIKFMVEQCTHVFGPKFKVASIFKNVNRSNRFYGGKHPNVTRVISVQGSEDPWHTLGITKNDTKGVTAIYIDGTAHCANLYDPYPNDPPQLIEADNQIRQYIANMLNFTCNDPSCIRSELYSISPPSIENSDDQIE